MSPSPRTNRDPTVPSRRRAVSGPNLPCRRVESLRLIVQQGESFSRRVFSRSRTRSFSQAITSSLPVERHHSPAIQFQPTTSVIRCFEANPSPTSPLLRPSDIGSVSCPSPLYHTAIKVFSCYRECNRNHIFHHHYNDHLSNFNNSRYIFSYVYIPRLPARSLDSNRAPRSPG